jgi:hypothetical protein
MEEVICPAPAIRFNLLDAMQRTQGFSANRRLACRKENIFVGNLIVKNGGKQNASYDDDRCTRRKRSPDQSAHRALHMLFGGII